MVMNKNNCKKIWISENLSLSLYHVKQLNQKTMKQEIEGIILMLKGLDIDGETMQYIIEKVGMHDQMLRQLVMTSPQSDVNDLMAEKIELDNQRLSAKNRIDATPERRLQFIKDDIDNIRTVINANNPNILEMDAHPECAIGTLLNNIEIACDLNDDEPNLWRTENEYKKLGQ